MKSELDDFLIERNRNIFFNAMMPCKYPSLRLTKKKYGFSQKKIEIPSSTVFSATPL